MEEKDARIRQLLQEAKTIAVVGLSPDPAKPSNVVAEYLKGKGFTIIPVNPGEAEILGEKSYGSLSAIPGSVDIVDIFMRPESLLPVVEEAVKLRPKAIWLQLGIVNEEARRIAGDAGIPFFQDVCIKVEHRRLFA